MKKIILLLFLLINISFAKSDVLHVYNWSEYIPEEVIEQFEKESGIKVKYDTYDSNEALYIKMKSSKVHYDVVFPSSYYLPKFARENLLQKVDKNKLKNFKNLDSFFLSREYDKNNDYAIPYVWGTTGVAYNPKKIKIPEDKRNSYKMLWDSSLAGKIVLDDDMREVFGMSLKSLGYSANSSNENEIKAAFENLKKIIVNVKAFNSESPKTLFMSGDTDAGLIWNGEVYMANKMAGTGLSYVYPKEGIMLWIDNMAIPKSAENIDGAYKFIDFILRPDIALRITQEMGYAAPNKAMVESASDELKSNHIVFIKKDDLKNSELLLDVSEETREIYNKYWRKLKEKE